MNRTNRRRPAKVSAGRRRGAGGSVRKARMRSGSQGEPFASRADSNRRRTESRISELVIGGGLPAPGETARARAGEEVGAGARPADDNVEEVAAFLNR